ncbi:hypothetical protein EKE90_20750 [Escherichia coli]|nr:hypothetical protein [Escherichia coli]
MQLQCALELRTAWGHENMRASKARSANRRNRFEVMECAPSIGLRPHQNQHQHCLRCLNIRASGSLKSTGMSKSIATGIKALKTRLRVLVAGDNLR